MKRLKRLRKLRCKKQKCKNHFSTILRSFFYKAAFISANNPIGQRNHSWLKVFNVLIQKVLELWQMLHENVKNWYILKLLSFLVANRAFFSLQNFVYFLKKPSWQPICSLLNVFEILSHQGFPKLHKDCIKFSKLDFFCVFVNFGQNLMIF